MEYKMNAIGEDLLTDPVRSEQEATENMAWGDNFLEINGVWYTLWTRIPGRSPRSEARVPARRS